MWHHTIPALQISGSVALHKPLKMSPVHLLNNFFFSLTMPYPQQYEDFYCVAYFSGRYLQVCSNSQAFSEESNLSLSLSFWPFGCNGSESFVPRNWGENGSPVLVSSNYFWHQPTILEPRKSLEVQWNHFPSDDGAGISLATLYTTTHTVSKEK